MKRQLSSSSSSSSSSSPSSSSFCSFITLPSSSSSSSSPFVPFLFLFLLVLLSLSSSIHSSPTFSQQQQQQQQHLFSSDATQNKELGLIKVPEISDNLAPRPNPSTFSSSTSDPLMPLLFRRRFRRQSDSSSSGGANGFLGGLSSIGNSMSGFVTNVGSRFTDFRTNFRDTVAKPMGEALNPRPAFESLGKFMSTASSNTMTRGREALKGVRDFSGRVTTGVRDRVTDAWDSMRDGWEEMWDL